MKSLTAFTGDHKEQNGIVSARRFTKSSGLSRVKTVLKLLIIILTTLLGMVIPLIIRVILDDAILKNNTDARVERGTNQE